LRAALIRGNQHKLCRAAELETANAHAPLHAADQAFSKKVQNHAWSMALFTTYYNFRIQKKLRVTPTELKLGCGKDAATRHLGQWPPGVILDKRAGCPQRLR